MKEIGKNAREITVLRLRLGNCTIVPGKVPGVPNTGPCGSKPLTISSIYLVALVETRCSPSKTHFEAPTLITFSWPTRHKLRGRSNRLLGGAAGKPGPGQAGALTLRRPPIRSKLRGRMHRSNRCGAGSPGPGQAGAPRLRRRPTRSKLRGTRTRGTPSLRRHQPPQPRAAAACGTR